MKSVTAAAVAAMAIGTGVSAGNIEPVVVPSQPAPPMAAVPSVTNWSGGYAGLSYNNISGANTITIPGMSLVFRSELEDTQSAGVFGGYNWQRGNFVFGGELSYTQNGAVMIAAPPEYIDDIIEVRGRGGYSFGRALAYGFAGYSMSTYDGSFDADLSGVSYGVGVDYLITDSIFAGIEYSQRKIEGDIVGNNYDDDSSVEMDLISVRFGYKF